MKHKKGEICKSNIRELGVSFSIKVKNLTSSKKIASALCNSSFVSSCVQQQYMWQHKLALANSAK